MKQVRTLLPMTQSKEIEIVAWRLSGGILITAEKRTALYWLLTKCFNDMFLRRREGERPFVIAGNEILKCILKMMTILLECLTFEDGTDMLPRNVGQQLQTHAG